MHDYFKDTVIIDCTKLKNGIPLLYSGSSNVFIRTIDAG